MASNLSLWELDPFFPAAEEVQDSTDRMESIYRAWKYTEGVAQESPGDSSIVGVVDANKRDLITALDTVRWQLEEFAKAVKVATTAAVEHVYPGEDAKSRHAQFVHAIQSQVYKMEREIGDSLWKDKLNSYASMGEADSKCLALFLAGADDDLVDSSSSPTGIEEHGVEQDNDSDPLLDSLPSISIRIETGPGLDDEFCSHNHSDRNGFSGRSSSSSSSSSSSRDGLVESKSFWSSIGGLFPWRARNYPSKMQMSASVMKRWKDGDAGILDKAEECISALKNRCLGRTGRKQPVNGSAQVFGFLGDCKLQRRWLRTYQPNHLDDTAKFAVGAVVVIVLVGLYLWFVSTLVPLDHQPVRGGFVN